jgi:hypothetical protein
MFLLLGWLFNDAVSSECVCGISKDTLNELEVDVGGGSGPEARGGNALLMPHCLPQIPHMTRDQSRRALLCASRCEM